MFGIKRCDVIKAAVRAMLVIPDVLAIVGNGGAWLFGAADCPRMAGYTDGLGDLGTSAYVALLGVNRPSYRRRSSREHHLQRCTDRHRMPSLRRVQAAGYQLRL